MTATDHARELVGIAARAADEKLGQDIVALDVSDMLALTDVFVLVSAPNDRQLHAIVDNVEEKLREAGVKPLRREGERDARWFLIDFGDIIVHVMHADERFFYQLERLWKDCPALPLGLAGWLAEGLTEGTGGEAGPGQRPQGAAGGAAGATA